MLPCCGLPITFGQPVHVKRANSVLSRIILEGKARNVVFFMTADSVVIYPTINYQ